MESDELSWIEIIKLAEMTSFKFLQDEPEIYKE